MELRLLQYVITVAEELSFTRAAKRHHISQPALSRQIRDLESQLGVQLFTRSTRQVELTAAGKAFVDEARAALAHSERAGRVAKAASRGESTPLAVGYSPHFNFELLALVRQKATARFGENGITFTSSFTPEQMENILAGQIDVGLGIFPANDPGLETILLLQDPVGVVVSKDHWLCTRESGRVRLDELKDDRVILLPEKLHPELYREVSAFWRSIGYKPQVTQEVTTVSEVVAHVGSGIGISFTKYSAKSIMPPSVRMLELFPEERPVIKLGAIVRKSGRSSKTEEFLSMVRTMKKKPLTLAKGA